MQTLRNLLVSLCAVAICLTLAKATLAGGGPENVALIVNTRSAASLTIANHYAQWRKIPALNIVGVDWAGSLDTITAKEFREKILVPTLTTLAQRGIAGQIDYVVYSTDFPFAINFEEFGPAKQIPASYKPQFFPVGSLTGMTYLWQWTVANSPDLVYP